jgi:hypothetical protein
MSGLSGDAPHGRAGGPSRGAASAAENKILPLVKSLFKALGPAEMAFASLSDNRQADGGVPC